MFGLLRSVFAKRELFMTDGASGQVERIREMMVFLREEYPGGWEDTGPQRQREAARSPHILAQ